MKQKLVALAAIASLCGSAAMARPVSYPGGWTVMQKNDEDMNGIHMHYSPTFRHSIGYVGKYWRDSDVQFHGAQLNYLLKRINGKGSQANFYWKNALGVALYDEDDASRTSYMAGMSSFAADWETRRYFTSYAAELHDMGNDDRFFVQKARLGIAPYIGDYGDTHTWLMVQVEHDPKDDDAFTVTPLVRLFKSEYLVEVGMNNHADLLFNWVVRF